MSKIIKIDGIQIPSPVEWKPSIMTLVSNSTRTGGGKMRFNEVAKKRKWDGVWKNLTQAEMATLVSSFENKAFFPIECYDPVANAVVTKTFYKGDRPFETPKYIGSDIFLSISVSFIEQ